MNEHDFQELKNNNSAVFVELSKRLNPTIRTQETSSPIKPWMVVSIPLLLSIVAIVVAFIKHF